MDEAIRKNAEMALELIPRGFYKQSPGIKLTIRQLLAAIKALETELHETESLLAEVLVRGAS